MTGRVDVRPARRADIGELSRVLARAFYDDPVASWEVPDDAVRKEKLHHLWTALTRHHHLAGGGVEIAAHDGTINAAAVWDPPGRWHYRRREELRMLPRLVWAFGWDLSRSAALTEAMKNTHPEEPHWYLAIVGSDPAIRGKGFGQALMRSRLDRCDTEHLPAYLESTNPANLPYYQRFGFEVTGEISLPDDGPTLWPMWREPR
jgi:GNAT superfamily N-acetyltransferase